MKTLQWLWQTCQDKHDTFLSQKSTAGHTVFLIAAGNGKTEVLKWLWQKCQDKHDTFLTQKSTAGYTAFLIAAGSGKVEILQWLWQKCQDKHDTFLAQKSNAGDTAFLIAAVNGKVEALKWLWQTCQDKHDTFLTQKSNAGYTAFLLAAGIGKVETLKWLWQKCQDKHHTFLAQKSTGGDTAFLLAAYNEKVEACIWLWAKCDFNKLLLFTSMEKVIRLVSKDFLSEYISLLRDQDGSTILHLLVSKQEKEKLAFAMTQDALKAICDVKENVTGKTCYHLASESGDEDIMKALLEVEDIYSLDVYTGYEAAEDYRKVLLLECGRRYILKAIAETKLLEVVQLVSILFDDSVLESLIVPLSGARGEDGKTVMHVAIESENLKSVGLLLRLPNTELRDIEDNDGKTAIEIAEEIGGSVWTMVQLSMGLSDILCKF